MMPRRPADNSNNFPGREVPAADNETTGDGGEGSLYAAPPTPLDLVLGLLGEAHRPSPPDGGGGGGGPASERRRPTVESLFLSGAPLRGGGGGGGGILPAALPPGLPRRHPPPPPPPLPPPRGLPRALPPALPATALALPAPLEPAAVVPVAAPSLEGLVNHHQQHQQRELELALASALLVCPPLAWGEGSSSPTTLSWASPSPSLSAPSLSAPLSPLSPASLDPAILLTAAAALLPAVLGPDPLPLHPWLAGEVHRPIPRTVGWAPQVPPTLDPILLAEPVPPLAAIQPLISTSSGRAGITVPVLPPAAAARVAIAPAAVAGLLLVRPPERADGSSAGAQWLTADVSAPPPLAETEQRPEALPSAGRRRRASRTAAAGAAHRSPGSAAREGRVVPMSRPEDGANASKYQCLLRRQIEFFETDQHALRAKAQGRNVPIRLGQVGIRCVHCARHGPLLSLRPDGEDPIEPTARGAAYYPAKVESLYQAVQNMANNHFLSQACPRSPPETVDAILEARRTRPKRSGGKGKRYFSHSAESLGIVNAPDGSSGIFMLKVALPDEASASASAVRSDAGTPIDGEGQGPAEA